MYSHRKRALVVSARLEVRYWNSDEKNIRGVTVNVMRDPNTWESSSPYGVRTRLKEIDGSA